MILTFSEGDLGFYAIFQFYIIRFPSELFKYFILCLCLFHMCPVYCPWFHLCRCVVAVIGHLAVDAACQ